MSGQAMRGQAMRGQAIRHMPLDHPAAAGHFPGNPIIPGAALLAEVLDAIASGCEDPLVPTAIPACKFHSPVRPGDVIVINWTGLAPGLTSAEARVTCWVEDRKVLTGTLQFGRAGGA